MIYGLLILLLIYAGLIGILSLGAVNLKSLKFNTEQDSERGFSIIVPFRNEASNIEKTLNSLLGQNYSKEQLEIILVDDHSEDSSPGIAQSVISQNPDSDIKLFTLAEDKFGKKQAISFGIEKAKHEWLLLTDADCHYPTNWVKAIDLVLKDSSVDMLVGPVMYSEDKSLLHAFQQLELACLQTATMGGINLEEPIMANGANLAYKKSAFQEVGGFLANEKVASGDDVFLLHKFHSEGKRIKYLKNKEAMVTTSSEPNLKDLINQRIRWAAKARVYKSTFSKFVGLLVFLTNLTIVLGPVLVLVGLITWKFLVYFFFNKLLMDMVCAFVALYYFGKKRMIIHHLWASFIYPFFSTYVAFASLFKGYHWKGRALRK